MTNLSYMAKRVIDHPAFRTTATVIRQAPGSRNEHGEFVPGETTEETVVLATAPGGESRNVTPDGGRLASTRNFWARTETWPIQVGAMPTEGVLIRWGGDEFRVKSVQDWQGFYTIVAVREEDP